MIDPGVQRVVAWIEEFGERLLAVARAFAGDADEAEDILQETWLIALRRQGTLDDRAQVGGWLYRIVLNVGRSRARKRARRARLLGRWGPTETATADDYSATVDGRVATVLWREIAELPPLQRTVLLHRVVDELSTNETACAVDRAEGTVKVCLHRALKRLEARLRTQGVDPSLLKEL
jgi:RNA polymerase sigma-70 factor (ECF subfamily)